MQKDVLSETYEEEDETQYDVTPKMVYTGEWKDDMRHGYGV